ncbi:MAG: hypothetical protein AAGD86_00170 [Pseudomonadota bacterium]
MQTRVVGRVRLIVYGLIALVLVAGVLTARAQLKEISLNSPATIPADI